MKQRKSRKRYRRRGLKVLCVSIRVGGCCTHKVDDVTREELKKYISDRLLKKYARQYKSDPVWAWTKIRESVQDATAAQKKEIIAAVESVSVVREKIRDVAESEAETMLQDDSLDINELARILGDN